MPVIAKTESLYLSSAEGLLSRHVPGFVHQSVSLSSSVPLNGSTLNHSLYIFSTHHRTCAERRKNGLCYELQLEAFRTGKYLEKLGCPAKHHQNLCTTGVERTNSNLSDNRDQINSSDGRSEVERIDTNSVKQSPCSPNKTFIPFESGDHNNTTKYISPQGMSSECVGTKAKSTHNQSDANSKTLTVMTNNMKRSEEQFVQQPVSKYADKDKSRNGVLVKIEYENTPQPCARAPLETSIKPPALSLREINPTKTALNKTRLAEGQPKTKRRRYSIPTSFSSYPLHPASYSDDASDDLSLSAEDCISGVISTPPIQPLEDEDGTITTPSPVSNPPLVGSKMVRTSSASSMNGARTDTTVPFSKGSNRNFTSTSQSCNTAKSVTTTHRKMQQVQDCNLKSANNTFIAKDDSLFQDLDDFTKVMEMVTMEQIAREKQVTRHQHQELSINSPSHNVSQEHFIPPRHVSPPPYYSSPTQSGVGPSMQMPRHYAPVTQMSSHPSTMPSYRYPITPIPRRLSEGQPFRSDSVEFRHPSHQQAVQSAMDSRHLRKHPQSLTSHGGSFQMDCTLSQQVQQGIPSPTIRHPPSTLVPTPPFKDLIMHCSTPSSTNPVVMNSQQPRTPTTPLEHFSGFTVPQSQTQPQHLLSPTHPNQFFPPATGTATISSYPFTQNRLLSANVPLSSPVGLSSNSGMKWPHSLQVNPSPQHCSQQGSLKEVLAQVNPHLEMSMGQKQTLEQDIGFSTSGADLRLNHAGPTYNAKHIPMTRAQVETNYTSLDTAITPAITSKEFSHTVNYQSHGHASESYPHPHPHPHCPL